MIRYGLFRIGSVGYAVPLLQLRKIVHQAMGYSLPCLPAMVAEVLVSEGRLVPLLMLPFFSEGGLLVSRSAEYKILTESESGMVALPAGETCGIVAGDKGTLMVFEGKHSSGIVGTFECQGREFKILDIDFLAISLTQGSENKPDIDGARRHQ